MSNYIFQPIGFSVRLKKSMRDYKCLSCKTLISKGNKRVVVDYKRPVGHGLQFASDSFCLSCGQKQSIKLPGETFYDKVKYELKNSIEEEDTTMSEQTFKPDFLFLVLVDCLKLPVFDPQDKPTKIIKTPCGFYVFFEQHKFDITGQQHLAHRYGGNPTIRRICKEGYTDNEGFAYQQYVEPEFEDDHRVDNPGLHMLYTKWACRHILIIDDSIKRLIAGSGGGVDGPVEALRKERAKLIANNAAYNDAHDILNEIRETKGKKKLSPEGYIEEA